MALEIVNNSNLVYNQIYADRYRLDYRKTEIDCETQKCSVESLKTRRFE